MNAYALRIRGLEHLISLTAARSELLAFPEVNDLLRAPGKERFTVLYEGNRPDPAAWYSVVSEAGYPASPIGPVHATGEAA